LSLPQPIRTNSILKEHGPFRPYTPEFRENVDRALKEKEILRTPEERLAIRDADLIAQLKKTGADLDVHGVTWEDDYLLLKPLLDDIAREIHYYDRAAKVRGAFLEESDGNKRYEAEQWISRLTDAKSKGDSEMLERAKEGKEAASKRRQEWNKKIGDVVERHKKQDMLDKSQLEEYHKNLAASIKYLLEHPESTENNVHADGPTVKNVEESLVPRSSSRVGWAKRQYSRDWFDGVMEAIMRGEEVPLKAKGDIPDRKGWRVDDKHIKKAGLDKETLGYLWEPGHIIVENLSKALDAEILRLKPSPTEADNVAQLNQMKSEVDQYIAEARGRVNNSSA